MTTAQIRTFKIAAGLGFLAVIFGAFGAHGLKQQVSPEMLVIFETGCRYHLAHALALLAVASALPLFNQSMIHWVCRCWWMGIAVFSGSLYLLALTGIKRWGMVTPLGGLLLILGWLILFFAAGRTLKNGSDQR